MATVTNKLNKQEKILNALSNGKAMTAKQLMKVSRHTRTEAVTATISQLNRKGHSISSVRENGITRYSMSPVQVATAS